MTDEEIIDFANEYADVKFDKKGRNKEYEFDNHGVIAFARRLESRYSLDETSWWFEEGSKIEREACAKICDAEADEWESRDICAILRQVAAEIRARGE
jgi:hypothetical protein